MSARAWAALAEYPFPGNVRELEHALQHAWVLSRGQEIDLRHFPAEISGAASPVANGNGSAFRALSDALKEFEREYLSRALQLTGGKKADAAAILGISRKNLWEKLKAHEMETPGLEDASPE